MFHIISDIKKYFIVLHIISLIILNMHDLKNVFNKKKDPIEFEKELKNIKNIEGLRDYTGILYDAVTLNIIPLLSKLITKYGSITKYYRKIRSKIRGE
jgi:hypothetical protein